MAKKRKFTLFRNIKNIYLDFFKGDKYSFLYLFVLIIATAITPFIVVLLPKLLLEQLVLENKSIAIIVLIIVGSALIEFFLNTITTFLRLSFDPKIERFISKLKVNTGKKIASLDQQDLENPTVLDLNSKAQHALSEWGSIRQIIYSSIYMTAELITLLGCAYIIFSLAWWMVIALFVPIILGFFNEYLWSKIYKRENNKLQPIWRKLLYITDIMLRFTFGKDIRLFNMQKWLIEKYDYQSRHEYKSLTKLWRNNLRNQLLGNVATLITSAIIYFYLVYSVINKGISIGDFLMYSTAVFTFVGNSNSFLESINNAIHHNRFIDDYYAFLNYDSEEENSNLRDINEIKQFNFVFENVSFKYPNQDEYALKNVNLKINNLEKVAIVGFNGAGKTTFIKLLTRLYEPTEGNIYLNGINIKEYPKNEYYNLFSVVFQEINIFAFSIKENVAMQNAELIDEKKVMDCLIKAGLEEKISSLEKGINTKLLKNIDESGINLSGGEAQKLVFARAMYKNAPFAIFDEPTSALDALAEYNLYNQFNTILKDKTAIYISHRLSSTRFCDRIVMFKDGCIVEEGTHDELILAKKEYYNMFTLQANYYVEEGDNHEKE